MKITMNIISTYSSRRFKRKVIDDCCPLSAPSSSFRRSWFQINLILAQTPGFLDRRLRVSASRQLNTTMHPVNAVSKAVQISVFDAHACARSSLRRIFICSSDKPILIIVDSEHIMAMTAGTSWYSPARSWSFLHVERHVAVNPT